MHYCYGLIVYNNSTQNQRSDNRRRLVRLIFHSSNNNRPVVLSIQFTQMYTENKAKITTTGKAILIFIITKAEFETTATAATAQALSSRNGKRSIYLLFTSKRFCRFAAAGKLNATVYSLGVNSIKSNKIPHPSRFLEFCCSLQNGKEPGETRTADLLVLDSRPAAAAAITVYSPRAGIGHKIWPAVTFKRVNGCSMS